MLIELTDFETGRPTYIDPSKIIAIEPRVSRTGEPGHKAETLSSAVHLDVRFAVQVREHPAAVIEAIGKQSFASPPDAPSNATFGLQQRFNSLLESLEELERFLDDEPAGHGVFEPAIANIREQLKSFDPR